jgi:hypothetical protein
MLLKNYDFLEGACNCFGWALVIKEVADNGSFFMEASGGCYIQDSGTNQNTKNVIT